MKGSRKYLLVAVAALLALTATATGCSTSGSTTTTTTTKTIKIGIGAPITAGATSLGQGMVRGAELAIAQANESAEVKALGITFQAVSGDDQGDPKTGVNVANTFVSDPNLLGVMGHLNSGVSIPASKIYADKKIIMVSPASTNPSLTQQGLAGIYRVCTTDAIQGPAAADYASKLLGFKTAYVIDDSTPYGEGLAAEFAKQFKANGGTVVATAKTSDKDTDFNALVTKIKSAKVDVIYYGGIYNAGALLAKQAHDGGIAAPLMSGDGLYDSQFIALAGTTQAEGCFATSVGLPIDKLVKGQEFKTAFEKKFPGKEIAAYDAYSYDAANVIIAAIVKAAKDSSIGVAKLTTSAGKDAIIANAAATKTTGITGDIAFDKNGDTTNKAITLYVVQGGKWVTKATPQ
ncbi:MAG: branched-chain amino acid ABC transporter substrate-binding protein [Coriobacteriia bacterium]|nr:branched-chain amino acid ABC transporter substrate-binding protein [Coriobacteriia bacterium]